MASKVIMGVLIGKSTGATDTVSNALGVWQKIVRNQCWIPGADVGYPKSGFLCLELVGTPIEQQQLYNMLKVPDIDVHLDNYII